MEEDGYLRGVANIKLLADNVWGPFECDYGAEFQDVFANISRRESLLSHRFSSISSADILSDIKCSMNETAASMRENPDATARKELADDILQTEALQLTDETGGYENYEHLNNDVYENKIESAYWEGVKAVGRGRQPETDVTYNNAFDPRLSFNGLGEDHCFLDDLEQDVSVQHNVYMNVEDVADLVDEYYNKYRTFLHDLHGSDNQQLRYAKKIQKKQPPKLHESPVKAFNIKKSYTNDDEQALAEILGSRLVKRYWKDYSELEKAKERSSFMNGYPDETQTPAEVPTSVPLQRQRTIGELNANSESFQTNAERRSHSGQPRDMSKLQHIEDGYRGTRESRSHSGHPRDHFQQNGQSFTNNTDYETMNYRSRHMWREPESLADGVRTSKSSESSNQSSRNTWAHRNESQTIPGRVSNNGSFVPSNRGSCNTWSDAGETDPITNTASKNIFTSSNPTSRTIWSAAGQTEPMPSNFTVNTSSSSASNPVPRYMWTDAWAMDRQQRTHSDNYQNNVPFYSKSALDEHEYDGTCSSKPAESGTYSNQQDLGESWQVYKETTENEREKQSIISDNSRSYQPNEQHVEKESQSSRHTSKAFSETSVHHEDVRSIPVLKATRSQGRDKDRTKGTLRSESSHTGVGTYEFVMPKRQSERLIASSPRETTQTSFVEGHVQMEVPKEPARGRSEIFPQESSKGKILDAYDSTTPKVPLTDSAAASTEEKVTDSQAEDRKSPSSETKFHNALRRYGWYGDNFEESEKSKPTSKDEKTSGSRWSFNLGQVCQPAKWPPGPRTAQTASSQTSSKRQLFRSASPTKRFTGNLDSDTESISPQKDFDYSDSWSRSNSVSPVKHHLLHNSSLNSDRSSKHNSSVSSLVQSPTKSASELNAACEPFVPAHLKSQESPAPSPLKAIEKLKQTPCQSPNVDAIKRLLQSPEVLAHMVASNDAKQAFLIQQKQQQIQQQPTQPMMSQYKPAKTSVTSAQLQTKTAFVPKQPQNTNAWREGVAITQHPKVIRRETMVQAHQPGVSIFRQKPPSHISFAHQQIPIHPPPPPFVRTNTLIPQWTCQPAPRPPQPTRPLGMNIAFEPPRPRTLSLAHQRYVPPLLAWQPLPNFQPQPRIYHHPVFNFGNVNNSCSSGGYDEGPYGYNNGSELCGGYREYNDVKVTKDTSSSRAARPIRANPDNLIHINTKVSNGTLNKA